MLRLVLVLLLATGAEVIGCPVPDRTPYCLITTASAEVGVKEVGVNSGPRVNEYLASTKLGPGLYWCGSFCHWCFRQCGVVLKPEREFAAASRFGQENLRWKRGKTTENISKDANTFCLFMASEGRIGHVGIIVGEDADYLYTIEGNTNDNGSRNGDGTYKRKRAKSTIYCTNSW